MAEAKAWQCGGKVAEFNFRGFPGPQDNRGIGSVILSGYRDRSLGLGAGKLGLKGLRRTGLKYSSGAFSYRWVAE